MKFEKIIVTPDAAKNLLSKMVTNRALKEKKVLQYKKDFDNKKWVVDTGETIKINKLGQTCDGMHRLNAIIQHGKPVTMWFAIGVENHSFKVIDSGSVRSGADTLKVSGSIYNNATAAAISMYFTLLNKFLTRAKLTNSEVLDIYQKNKSEWDDAAKFSSTIYAANKILPQSIGTCLMFLFSQINPIDAKVFMTELNEGRNFTNNSIYLLRQKFIQESLSNAKTDAIQKCYLAIKSWNAYRSGSSIKLLKFNSDLEQVPEAI
jgi:hypothetical protein